MLRRHGTRGRLVDATRIRGLAPVEAAESRRRRGDGRRRRRGTGRSSGRTTGRRSVVARVVALDVRPGRIRRRRGRAAPVAPAAGRAGVATARAILIAQEQARAEHEAGSSVAGGRRLVRPLNHPEATRERRPTFVVGGSRRKSGGAVDPVLGRDQIRRVDGRPAVDQVRVVAYQGVLAEGRLLGAPVAELVPVIVAHVVDPAVGLDVGVKSHRTVQAGEARLEGRRGRVLRSGARRYM